MRDPARFDLHKRWLVRVTYRTDAGQADVDHHIEELSEIHGLVERGPMWDCIEQITIVLNPYRQNFAGTVEEAARL